MRKETKISRSAQWNAVGAEDGGISVRVRVKGRLTQPKTNKEKMVPTGIAQSVVVVDDEESEDEDQVRRTEELSSSESHLHLLFCFALLFVQKRSQLISHFESIYRMLHCEDCEQESKQPNEPIKR